MQAMHLVATVRVSPEGNLIVAIFPSLAISCAKAPALRAIIAPAPGFSSIHEMTVPNGIFDNGKALPTSGEAFSPELICCPTLIPL